MRTFEFLVIAPSTINEQNAVFIETISDINQAIRAEIFGRAGTDGLLYGHIYKKDEGIIICIYAKHFIPFYQNQLVNYVTKSTEREALILGYIIIIDSKCFSYINREDNILDMDGLVQLSERNREYIQTAREELNRLHQVDPNAHYIIALLNHDEVIRPSFSEIRNLLELHRDTKFILYDPSNRNHVKDILLTILNSREKTPFVDKVIEIIGNL